MFKTLALLVLVLLALAQGYFIYAVQHGGAGALGSVWSSFDIAQSGYSVFVLDSIRWWWALPVTGLLLAGLSVWKGKRRYAVMAVVLSLLGTVALYGSVYAPSLLIQV
jgi:hypothetical protein